MLAIAEQCAGRAAREGAPRCWSTSRSSSPTCRRRPTSQAGLDPRVLGLFSGTPYPESFPPRRPARVDPDHSVSPQPRARRRQRGRSARGDPRRPCSTRPATSSAWTKPTSRASASTRRKAGQSGGLGLRASDFREPLERPKVGCTSFAIRPARARDLSQLAGGPRPEVRGPLPESALRLAATLRPPQTLASAPRPRPALAYLGLSQPKMS